MPDMLALSKCLEQTWIGASVRESVWLFPAIDLMKDPEALANVAAADESKCILVEHRSVLRRV